MAVSVLSRDKNGCGALASMGLHAGGFTQRGRPRRDGAKWIWEHIATLFGSQRTEIVDWYHATEHVWTAGKGLYGDDRSATQAWANTALDAIWQH